MSPAGDTRGVLSPRLLGVFCAAVPFAALSAAWFGRRFHGLARETATAQAAATAEAAESLGAGAITTVKALSAEEQRAARYDTCASEALRCAERTAVGRGSARGVGAGLDGAAAAAVLWFGASEVLDGSLSCGVLATFVLLATRAADDHPVRARVPGGVVEDDREPFVVLLEGLPATGCWSLTAELASQSRP